jgi:hypothetical protein
MNFFRTTVASLAFSLACTLSASAQTTTTPTSSNSGSTLGDASLSAPPAITSQSNTTTTSTALNRSNSLSPYYANPYFQGRAGATSTTAPGGFGTSLYGTAGSGASTSGSSSNPFAANTGANAGATTNTGRNTGNTATGQNSPFGTQNPFSSQNRNNTTTGTGTNNSGVVVPLPRQIAYTATLNFKAPAVTTPQMQTNLRASLERSTMLSNPKGIELTMDGPVVVLKGNVVSEDEQRLVEGMIRLTPGVRDVRNELKVVAQAP